MKSEKASKYFFDIFIILLLLSIFIIHNFDSLNYSFDKDQPIQRIIHANNDVIDIIFKNIDERHPPLIFLVLHFVIKVFGTSEFPLRFVSFFFSGLTLVGFYILSRKYFSRIMSFLSTMLFQSYFFFRYYSSEVGNFSLFMFLSVISLLVFYSVLKNGFLGKNTVWFIIINSLLFLSNYLSIFLLFSQFIFLVFYKQNIKSLKKILLLFLIIGLVVSPRLLLFVDSFFNDVDFLDYCKDSNVCIEKFEISDSSFFDFLKSFSRNSMISFFIVLMFLFLLVCLLYKLIISNHDVLVFEKFIFFYFIVSFFLFFLASKLTRMRVDYMVFLLIPLLFLITKSFYFKILSEKFQKTSKIYILFLIIFVFLFLIINFNSFKYNQNNYFASDSMELVTSIDKNFTYFVYEKYYTNILFQYYLHNETFYYKQDPPLKVININNYNYSFFSLNEMDFISLINLGDKFISSEDLFNRFNNIVNKSNIFYLYSKDDINMDKSLILEYVKENCSIEEKYSSHILYYCSK